MSAETKRYIPALSRWLTWLYDPLLRWGMREETFKRALIGQADIKTGMSVLDLGCGTGTLTIMAKKMIPGMQMTGLDGDPKVLGIARAKAEQARAEIQFDLGMAFSLPYSDASFDVVISSLMVHHLSSATKMRAFHEVRRVLKPGGSFHIVNFGPPFNSLTKVQAFLIKNLEEVEDNFEGRISSMLMEAGFEAEITQTMNTVFGPLAFYYADKTDGENSSVQTKLY